MTISKVRVWTRPRSQGVRQLFAVAADARWRDGEGFWVANAGAQRMNGGDALRLVQRCWRMTPASFDEVPPCAGCGKCCHLLVELTPGVDDHIPLGLVVEHSGVRCMDQGGDGACAALDPDTQLCTIYDERPQVCRDFTRGDSLCRRAVFGRRGSLLPDVSGRGGPAEGVGLSEANRRA